ncbi:phage tail tape measure protein [Ruminococcus callidus]|uniref:phage tail tape measure protein n=1 Tax=Ruminococcus callidus TaxID=40519 RepID=UPI003FD6C545
MADYTLSAKITGDASKFQKAMQQAETSMQKLNQKFGSFGGALETLGGKMTSAGTKITALEAAAGGAAVALGTQAVKAGASFEAEMSKVSAISGSTGNDLKALTDKAKEMGKKTKFSATESAEAFEYMAMAGWKTDDMLNGIEGIMNLAAASGEDLATTSDIVTDALTAFGLSASDSAEFSDVLAAASSNANTNVSMMGDTFKYVAPVAGALGYSVQDTAIAVGLMANSGIKASQAGTSLRAILSRLAKPTEQVQTAMNELGISLTDSNGNMKSMRQVMEDMRNGFSGLTKDQQANYAATIGGQEAMSGLLAIVNASEEDFNKLTTAIDGSEGTCKNMANTMQKNLSGQFTILKSQIEGINIQIFEKMEPALLQVVQAANGMISAFNAAKDAGGVGKGIEAAIKALDGMVSAGAISDVFSTIADKLKSLKDSGVPIEKIAAAAAALGPTLVVAGKASTVLGGGFQSVSGIIGSLSGVFGGAKSEISGLAGWFGKFSGLLKNAKGSLLAAGGAFQTLFGKMKLIGGGIFGKIGTGLSALASKFSGITGPIKNVAALLGGKVSAVFGKVSGVFSKIGGVFGAVGEKLAPLISGFQDFAVKIGGALSSVLQVAGSFGGQFTSILMKAFGFGAIGGLILVGLGLIQKNFGDKIGEILTMVQEKAPQIITDFCTGITEKIPELISQGAALVGNLLDTLTALAPSIISGGANILVSLAAGFAEELPALLEKAGGLIISIVQALTEKLPVVLNTGMQIISSLVQGISGFLPELIPAAVEMILTLADSLVDQLPDLIDSGIQLLEAVVEGILTALPKITEKAPEIIMKLADTLIEKGPELILTAAELMIKLAEGLIQAIPTLVAKIPEIVQHIKDKFLETDWSELGRQMMNLLVDGLKAVANLAIGGINLLIDGVNLIPGFNIPQIPYLAHGTENWQGGFARMNEGGRGELVNLPDGTQVIPHDLSRQYAKEAARMNSGGYAVSIDYVAIGNAVAEAMAGVDMHTTLELDGKAVADVTTPYIDKNLGHRAQLSSRYAR